MATFKWYLNRQGPQGQRGQDGAKGDPGNTPIFSDGQNTPTVYTMIIDLGDGNTFETKNLKYPMRDDGGDYLRYDISEDTVYLGEPNKADLAGKEGEVRLATTTSVDEETVLDTDAVSYELFEDNNEKVTTALGNLDDKIEDVDDKVDAEADTRSRNDGILDNRISLAEGQITSLNNTKASKQELTDGLAGKANVIHTHTLSQITDAGSLAGKNTVDYQTEVTNKPTLGNLASKDTVNYETEVTNKPVIPIPGDGTITITQGGVTKGTFTTNQSSNATIALDAGGGASFTAGTGLELTNQDVLNVKIDGSTITTNANGELVASGGATYTEGPGITIDGNNTISVNYDSTKGLVADGTTGALGVRVDGTSIVMNNGALTAPGPDLSAYATKSALSSTINFTNTYTRTYTAYGNEFNSTVCTYGEPMSSGNYEDITVEDDYGTLIRLKPITGVPVRTLTLRNPYRLEFDTITIPRGISFDLTVEQSANSSYGQHHLTDYDLDNAEWGSGTLLIKNFAVNRNSSYYTIAPNSGDFANSKYLWALQIGDTNEDILVRSPKAYGQNFIFSYEDVATPTTTLKPATANRVGGVSVASGSNLTISGTGALAADNMRPTAGSGIDVNNTEVSVKIDNNTIKINDSGQLYAKDTLPSQTGNSGKFLTTDGSATSWATIPQPDLTNYYTKTQTDSLLNEKISTNIVQSPLEYDNGIEGTKFVGLDSNHIGTATPITGYKFVYPSTSYITINGNNVQGSVNILNALCSNGYVEIPIINNNFIYDNALERAIIFGKYINNNFIMNAVAVKVDNEYLSLVSSDFLDNNVSSGTIGNVTKANRNADTVLALTWTNSYVYCASNNYVSSGATGTTWSVNSAGTLISRIADSTHIRVVAIGTTTQDYDNIDVREPEQINLSGSSMQFGNAWESATNMIEYDGTNPSLSLKYDSSTLGVNANNELTVPTATTSNKGLVQPDGTTITINNGVISAAGSAPSNMVTTDTTQTISARKDFTNTQVFSGGQYYSNVDGIQLGKGMSITRGTSGSANITLSSDVSDYIDLNDSSNNTIGSIVAKNQKFRLVAPGSDTKIYKENSTPINNPTNFLLEKDMLDGTTIQYNSTSGKVEVIGGGGGSNITIDEANLSTEDFVEEGSPTITRSNGDIIVTSSSWDDYVRSTNNIDINNNVFEVKTAIKPTVSVSSDNILAQRESTNVYGWSIYQTSTGLGFWMNKDGNNVFNQVFSYSFTTNVKYYIKLTGNGSEIGMYVKSENDSDYTKIGYISTNANLSFTNGPTPIRTCYLSGQQYINDTSVSKNGTMIYQGVIPFNDTLTKASTSQFGLVKVDGSTITVNNGVISAASSAPSNMVTTDTVQDLSNSKYFTNDNRIHLGISNSSSPPYGNYNQISKYGFNAEYFVSNSNYGSINFSTFYGRPGFTVLKNGNPATTIEDNYGNYWFNTGALDGTTIMYNSSTGKVSAVNPVQSTTVHNIVQLTQSEYDTLVNNNTVDSNTFYIITST